MEENILDLDFYLNDEQTEVSTLRKIFADFPQVAYQFIIRFVQQYAAGDQSRKEQLLAEIRSAVTIEYLESVDENNREIGKKVMGGLEFASKLINILPKLDPNSSTLIDDMRAEGLNPLVRNDSANNDDNELDDIWNNWGEDLR